MNNFTVLLAYSDYPSITNATMNGAIKRFSTAIKKLGGTAIEIDKPSWFGEAWFDVSGCSFEDIEKKWKDERFWIYLKNYQEPIPFSN